MKCKCDDGWVCESHPNKPWPHGECGGAGMPCRELGCPDTLWRCPWSILSTSKAACGASEGERMSGDNYLWVNEHGEVFEGCASADRRPTRPIHKADTVGQAVAWANDHQRHEVVEYGISLSAEAEQILLEG